MSNGNRIADERCNACTETGAISKVNALYMAKCAEYYKMRDEHDALKAELDAVMQLGVDKWLEGDALNNNTATRAAEARKVALGAIDALRAEVERLREAGKEVISADAEWGENPKQMENWADAIAHLEQALRGEGADRG